MPAGPNPFRVDLSPPAPANDTHRRVPRERSVGPPVCPNALRLVRRVVAEEAFRGVAVRVLEGAGEAEFRLSVLHEDVEREIPLAAGSDAEAIAREWQAWAKALGLPLIAVEADGSVSAELSALGVVLAERPSARRKGSPLVGRRSRYARRRRGSAPLRPLVATNVVAGREIIART